MTSKKKKAKCSKLKQANENKDYDQHLFGWWQTAVTFSCDIYLALELDFDICNNRNGFGFRFGSLDRNVEHF